MKKQEIKLACNVIQQVEEICDKHGNKPGELINVLHECQALHGYLPEEMQRIIARKLGVPASKVYGVVTFYSFFTMKTDRSQHRGHCTRGEEKDGRDPETPAPRH